MKKILLLLLMIVSISIFAQDELIYRDGETYKVKVIEITDTEVKYRKWNNLNGPIYTESQSELFMLIFENVEKEIFDNKPKSKSKVKIYGLNSAKFDNYLVLQSKDLKFKKIVMKGGIMSL